jgi:hypothetical protein
MPKMLCEYEYRTRFLPQLCVFVSFSLRLIPVFSLSPPSVSFSLSAPCVFPCLSLSNSLYLSLIFSDIGIRHRLLAAGHDGHFFKFRHPPVLSQYGIYIPYIPLPHTSYNLEYIRFPISLLTFSDDLKCVLQASLLSLENDQLNR